MGSTPTTRYGARREARLLRASRVAVSHEGFAKGLPTQKGVPRGPIGRPAVDATGQGRVKDKLAVKVPAVPPLLKRRRKHSVEQRDFVGPQLGSIRIGTTFHYPQLGDATLKVRPAVEIGEP